MAKTPLLLLGGGGHCAAVIDVIESTAEFEVAGIVEAEGTTESTFLGYPVLGTDADLPDLIKIYPNCVITVGQIQSAAVRRKLFEKVKSLGGQLPVVKSPLAKVSKTAEVCEGTVIMHLALVNALVKIGENGIVNTKSLIEHGTEVGADSHISTGAIINGDCHIGEGCLIGSGAILLQGIRVADQTLVGAGAVVTKNIDQPGVYLGNPAHLQDTT